MNDFRKNMFISYKKKLASIIDQFLIDAGEDGDQAFEPNTQDYIDKWVDANCLPMGDFDKEKSMRKLEEWSK